MALDLYIEGFAVCAQEPKPEDFSPWFEARRLRRVDGLSARLLLSACRALDMAGQPVTQEKPFGLSLGVGPGSLQNTCKFMDSILQDGDELSSPTAFAGSVHNAPGLTLSLFLNLRGPCVTSGQFNTSFGAALLTARAFLHNGMAPYVLLAVGDSLNPVARALNRQYPARLACTPAPDTAPVQAAAFLLSPQKTPASKARIMDFDFTFAQPAYCPAVGEDWAPLAAAPAIQLCGLLERPGHHFTLTASSLGVCSFLKGESFYAYQK